MTTITTKVLNSYSWSIPVGFPLVVYTYAETLEDARTYLLTGREVLFKDTPFEVEDDFWNLIANTIIRETPDITLYRNC